MGTDIHGVFQSKRSGKWVSVPTKYSFDRHYALFAWLGDIRNGHGFAGVPTHTRITPLSCNRGLPDDFEYEDDDGAEVLLPVESLPEWRRESAEPDENGLCRYWMGEHSYSWLSAEEILNAPLPRILRTGIV